MEKLDFDYPRAKRRITRRAHVGVVRSGDMEVLMEPSQTESARQFHLVSVAGAETNTGEGTYEHIPLRAGRYCRPSGSHMC
jgi:hypothetical protein